MLERRPGADVAAQMSEDIRDETELIQTYLAPLAAERPGAFGLADDAALIPTVAGVDLVVSSDPIIAGVHFFADDRADDIAWKALAVNVSDLIAKGSEPLSYILTLAFPQRPQRDWMASFATGLAAAQAEFGCALIGGDTDRTPGPLTIGVTMFASSPRGTFVRRQGAAVGDVVYVTGTLGDAAAGLALRLDAQAFGDFTEGDRSFLIGRYLRPSPRLALAATLRAHATAAIDISDGLMKDLSRLLGSAGGLAAPFSALPLSTALSNALMSTGAVADMVLAGGGDYEVLFTVAEPDCEAMERDAAACGVAVTAIGAIVPESGVLFVDASGRAIVPRRSGYDHFAR